MDGFDSQLIDWEPIFEIEDGKEIFLGNEVVKLKTNKNPQGLVELEIMFGSANHYNIKICLIEKIHIKSVNF